MGRTARGSLTLCAALEDGRRNLVRRRVDDDHLVHLRLGLLVSQGLFPKERFRYDGGEDIYICPDGQRLALHSKRKRRDLIFVSYANRAACKECQLKSKCTKSAFRRVLRYVDEAILERMAERLAAPPRSCSMRAVKASSIPSAQSNNGWARVLS